MAIKEAKIKISYDGKEAEAGIKRMNNYWNTFRKLVTTVVAGKMIKDVTRFGREMSNLSYRTGMSVERLSSLRNVFIAAGAGARGLEKSIGAIHHGLMALQRGETEWATKLYPLGISPWGKDAEQVNLEIADSIKRMLDMGSISQEQAIDYLMSEFGKNEKEAKLMLGGRMAILSEEARLREKVGVAQDQNIKNLDNLKTSLDELSASWENAKTNVIGFFSEPLMQGVDALTSLLKYFGDNEVIGGIAGLGAILFGIKGSSATAAMLKGALTGTGGAITAGGVAAGAVGLVGAVAIWYVIAETLQAFYDFYKAESISDLISEWQKDAAEGKDVAWYKKFAIGYGYFGEEFANWLSDPNAVSKYMNDGKIDYDLMRKRKEELENMRANGGLSPKQLYELDKLQQTLSLVTPYLEEAELMKNVKVIYSDEPPVEDLDGVYGDDNSKDIKIEFHQEGSNFNGSPQQNAELMGQQAGNALKFGVSGGLPAQ